MDGRAIVALPRVAFAALAIVAIAVQAADLAVSGTFDPANFLSYFTIQSNLIGAVLFLVLAVRHTALPSPGWDLARGAAVFNLSVTFVVFAVLLSGTDVDVAVPWVNTVVHGVFPIAVLADWLLVPPARPIGFPRSLAWLAFPLAWLGYTLVRGALVGWYPYPFLDPENGGYGSVSLYVLAILAFGIVLAAALAWIANAARAKSPMALSPRR